jgi:hypothetical protein
MLTSLVAAVALGFVGGPSADAMDLTETGLSNRALIVGTWERRESDGVVEVWEFRRHGHFTAALLLPNGRRRTTQGTYRVEGQRLELGFAGRAQQTRELMQLDRRLLVWDWGGPTRYRRR